MMADVVGLALHGDKTKIVWTVEALKYLSLLTDTSIASQLNRSSVLRPIPCQCKALRQLSKLLGIHTVAWLRRVTG